MVHVQTSCYQVKVMSCMAHCLGNMVFPKRIIEAAHIREGDMLSFDLDSNNRIIIRRIESTIDSELLALQETLSEWNSPEDDEAWRDL